MKKLTHFRSFFLVIVALFSFYGTSKVMASESILAHQGDHFYKLKETMSGKRTIKTKGEESFNIKSGQLNFKGEEFLGGEYLFNDKVLGIVSVIISNAYLGKGGIFNCRGIITINKKSKTLFFDVKLDPIKNGFNFESKISMAQEDFSLKFYDKKTKTYNDIIFDVKAKFMKVKQ